MQEFFIKTKEKFKDILRFKKINPHVYWNNLLHIFMVVIIGLIVMSFYLLYKIKTQQIIHATPISTTTPNLINEKLYKKVNTNFETKQSKVKELQSGSVIYKDPSIN